MTQLYRHFDSDGALLYVGISLSAIRRLCEHRQSPWTDNIANVTVEKFNSLEAAREAERAAIRTEKPRHNIAMANDIPDNVTHVRALASRLRRSVTNRELLDIIEFVLGETECPNCRDARLANRERQARHREKRRAAC